MRRIYQTEIIYNRKCINYLILITTDAVRVQC